MERERIFSLRPLIHSGGSRNLVGGVKGFWIPFCNGMVSFLFGSGLSTLGSKLWF